MSRVRTAGPTHVNLKTVESALRPGVTAARALVRTASAFLLAERTCDPYVLLGYCGLQEVCGGWLGPRDGLSGILGLQGGERGRGGGGGEQGCA